MDAHERWLEESEDADAKPAAIEEVIPSSGCPHIDRNDSRCAHRFSLGRIDQAFSVCLGAFYACPIFHRISAESHGKASVSPIRTAAATAPRATLTISAGKPLRATGT